MTDAAKALAALALAVALVFVAPLIGITVGAFAGWVVGKVFPGTVAIVAGAITGGATMPAWQVGAVLGFVGGFFKTSIRLAKKD